MNKDRYTAESSESLLKHPPIFSMSMILPAALHLPCNNLDTVSVACKKVFIKDQSICYFQLLQLDNGARD